MSGPYRDELEATRHRIQTLERENQQLRRHADSAKRVALSVSQELEAVRQAAQPKPTTTRPSWPNAQKHLGHKWAGWEWVYWDGKLALRWGESSDLSSPALGLTIGAFVVELLAIGALGISSWLVWIACVVPNTIVLSLLGRWWIRTCTRRYAGKVELIAPDDSVAGYRLTVAGQTWLIDLATASKLERGIDVVVVQGGSPRRVRAILRSNRGKPIQRQP